MCEPATIMAVAAVASTAFTIQSQQRQARHAKGTADYNARVAENEAENVRTQATEAENIQRQKTAQLLSKQRAQLGASGVELGSGSALQIQEDTVALGEADALRIRSNFGSQIDALNTESAMLQMQGSNAAAKGRSDAVGTLLTGASTVIGTGVADKWLTPKSAANQPPPHPDLVGP